MTTTELNIENTPKTQVETTEVVENNTELPTSTDEVQAQAEEVVAKPKRKRKEKKGGAAGLDDDFENFEVEEEKAMGIRLQLEAIKKEEKLINSLRDLCLEKGVEEKIETGDELPGFKSIKNDKAKVYKVEDPEHSSFGFKIWQQAHDMRLSYENETIIDVSFLIKGSEFLVNFASADKWKLFNEKTAGLKSEFEEARKAKAERQKVFKERFKKKKKA